MSNDQKIKGAAPCQENAPFKYTSQENTKESSILKVLKDGRSLNRFEAEPLGDHCLHSTISTLRRKGTWSATSGKKSLLALIEKFRSKDTATLD